MSGKQKRSERATEDVVRKDSRQSSALNHKNKRACVGHEVMLRLNCFAAYVKVWRDPPREVMSFIARRFQRYIDAEGKLTLDEAFSLRSTQSAGNPAKRLARRTTLDSALIDIFMRIHTEGVTRKQGIEDFIAEHQFKNPTQPGGDAAWYGNRKITKSVLEQEAKSLHAQDIEAELKRTMKLPRSRQKRLIRGK